MIKVFEAREREQFIGALRDASEENDLLFTGAVHIRSVMDAAKANNGRFQVYASEKYIFAERTPAGEMFTIHFVDMPAEDIVMRQTWQDAGMEEIKGETI